MEAGDIKSHRLEGKDETEETFKLKHGEQSAAITPHLTSISPQLAHTDWITVQRQPLPRKHLFTLSFNAAHCNAAAQRKDAEET